MLGFGFNLGKSGPRASNAAVEPSFPAKDFYFADFAGIADATTLRSLEGWSAYNSAAATTAQRDQWKIQSGKATRVAVSEDYATNPGVFVIGRSAGSTDHVLRTKVTAFPSSGGMLNFVVGATHQNNCLILSVVVSAGAAAANYIMRKNVNGTLTTLLNQAGVIAPIGRNLLVGDTVELSTIGSKLFVTINGLRVTPAAGVDIGVFTKGDICGFGTGTNSPSSYDDIYVAAISASLTVNDTPVFWPALLGSAGRIVPFAGTYTGDVQAIDYRVVNAATLAEVKPWARASGAVVAAGAWSASVLLPMSDIVSNPACKVQFRAANDTDATTMSTTTAVGFSVGSYGQSNSEMRGQGLATSHAVQPYSYTFSSGAGREWQGNATTTQSRTRLMASKLAQAVGIPCGVFIGGTGSRHIYELNRRGDGTLALDEMEQLCSEAFAIGYISSWLWTQGEAEAADAGAFNESYYHSEFDLLTQELSASIAAGSPIRIGICNLSSFGGTHVAGGVTGDTNWSAVRAGLSRLGDKAGVYISTNMADLAKADEFHLTPDAYVESGRRAALSMAKDLGYGAYDGRGPLVTGASRSGAVVTLAIDLNGASSIAGTGLTHYQVSADNFATLLTVSSAAVSGGNIALTLSADPGAAVKVRSFYGMDWTSPVRAIGTYADGTTIPVEPLFSGIAAV